ncbi:DNA-binding transcriptional ArsR family regulator [Saccharothrix tamanrassetensis]|uniref:DNA-binding transcriptional ArsR family regulator n=1 Tax=Saccharothrix tamanrassetensis TaxID=1051531 RepID=A0A841CMP3_9PSEU|nr:helix-turn-helix domain-containing protein [Saccharothrix tamanrassetensis]MBB5958569.1 DNA-binding transcriptional ArsR family regulator [Saccharothrix tamanrassetensis]
MITVELGGDALASVRFALSPLMEIGTVLNQGRGPARHREGWLASAQDTMARRRLVLMACFMSQYHGYVPDFLNPEPAAYDPDLHGELHAVASTPAERVAAEMAGWVERIRRAGPRAEARARPVLDALHRGEDFFAAAVADELAQYWRHGFARRWPGVQRRLDADIERRSRAAGRDGLGTVLRRLHPDILWADQRLRIRSRNEGTIHESRGLVLMPSTYAWHAGVGVDPLGVRTVHVVYPAMAVPASAPALGDVLGHTRAALLGDLDVPRTTTDLARRHHLSPSTVSYHLGRLSKAGLVDRERAGQRVRYRRSLSNVVE